jgi:hypothetical protein
MRPSIYKFKVPGGLGNQLFAYYSALYTSKKVVRDVIIDFSTVDRTHFTNGIALLSFNLAVEELSVTNSLPSSSIYIEKFRRLKRQIISRTFLERVETFTPGLDTKSELDKYLDSNTSDNSKKVTIEGYFSDFAFYDEIPKALRSLRLTESSAEFRKYSRLLENERTLAIHHRLGDFLSLGDSVGILSKLYFKDALERANTKEFERILIFSNDPVKSESLFSEWKIKAPKMAWMGPGELPNPAETLSLISLSDSVICSNSTFSFWAAKLKSATNNSIFYPSLFRKDAYTEIFSIPRDWIPVPSKWTE